jgi:hypothetical protein
MRRIIRASIKEPPQGEKHYHCCRKMAKIIKRDWREREEVVTGKMMGKVRALYQRAASAAG